HTRSKRDWSSDVCSSDLGDLQPYKYVPLYTWRSGNSTGIARWPQKKVYHKITGLYSAQKKATCPRSGNPASPCQTPAPPRSVGRSEEHTSELQSRFDLVC